MGTLVRQELFKLTKKKSTIAVSVLLVAYMVIFFIFVRENQNIIDPPSVVSQLGGGLSWSVFVMIAAASTMIAMESQYGTLKNLLYRTYSRNQVLASKWITLFLYSIYLYLLIFVTNICLKFILFPDISLSDKLEGSSTIIESMGYFMLGNFIGLWLIISLVLMISCFFNTSAAAISAGIIFYFASSILSGLMMMVIEKWNWLKWNPINMLNLPKQIGSESVMIDFTHLTTDELIIGNIVYIILFLGLGLLVFRRKNV